MDELSLFTAALGLSGPWRVTRTEFDAERTQLDLSLDFDRGARFGCPAKDCAHSACEVQDTTEKTWRHLDFFQHKAFLHARQPRVRCPEHGVRQVSVPWARPGSGFTLLFEALALSFAQAMPVSKLADLTREHDTRIWRVLEHHVHAARDQQDFSGVRQVGVDETSARKGQDLREHLRRHGIRAGTVRHRGPLGGHRRPLRRRPGRAPRRPEADHRHQLRHEHRIHRRDR